MKFLIGHRVHHNNRDARVVGRTPNSDKLLWLQFECGKRVWVLASEVKRGRARQLADVPPVEVDDE